MYCFTHGASRAVEDITGLTCWVFKFRQLSDWFWGHMKTVGLERNGDFDDGRKAPCREITTQQDNYTRSRIVSPKMIRQATRLGQLQYLRFNLPKDPKISSVAGLPVFTQQPQLQNSAEVEAFEIARIAALDRQRNARDKMLGRGYDYHLGARRQSRRRCADGNSGAQVRLGRDVRPGDDILYVSDVCIVLAGEPEMKPCPVCRANASGAIRQGFQVRRLLSGGLEMTTCKGCGTPITWSTTEAGRSTHRRKTLHHVLSADGGREYVKLVETW